MDIVYEDIELDRKQPVRGGLKGFEHLSSEDQEKELSRMYREVFSSEKGKIVLTSMLEDLYFFRQCKNEQSMALSNYAKFLVYDRLKEDNNFEVVNKIFSNGNEKEI